jgi:serine protease Do
MFRKSIQVPVWLMAVVALALLSVGAFAGAIDLPGNNVLPALRLALPPGANSVGVYFSEMSASAAYSLGLGNKPGLVVTGLQCGYLQPGDIITAVNGQPVATTMDLVNYAESVAPGSPLSLLVIRGGAQQLISVARPTALPPSTDLLSQQPPIPPQPLPLPLAPVQPPVGEQYTGVVMGVIRGVQADTLTSTAVQQLGLSPVTTGVLVTGLDSGAPAELAGLRTNDVIVEVNSMPVSNVFDYEKIVGGLGSNSATLKIIRRGAVLYVTIPAH